jgi:hypothetical protein
VTGSTNKLYYCKADLQIDGDADWTELYDLGTGAGTVSIAVLNDRAVFTEGVNKPPLVWGGSIETDGSDWQTPKNVVLSWDDVNFHDATSSVTDPDTSTTEAIGDMGSGTPTVVGAIYVCLDQAKCSGLYINMGTVSTDADCQWQYWNGSEWHGLASVTDGTSDLTQDGVVTFTEVTISNSLVADIPGFWIRIAPQTTTAAAATISEIRFKAPCQNLQTIGDGLPDIPMACMWQDVSVGAVHEIAADVSDYTPATYQLLNDGNPDTSLAAPFAEADYWYIGYPLQFSAVEIEVNGNYPNTNAETIKVYYWNGSGWVSMSNVVDSTAESGACLNHKGKISWTMPTTWKMCRPISHQYPLGYYVRLSIQDDS